MEDIKKKITDEIVMFVKDADDGANLLKLWKTPLVGFADVRHPYIRNLRKFAGGSHQLPEEVLKDGKIIIAYFIPFSESVVTGNKEPGLASPQWAEAYEKTNEMFPKLNIHLTEFIEKLGFKAKQSPEASVFYRDELMSHWSFRHFAYAAGLGTFGMNNMLITEAGCAGRVNAMVTNADMKPDSPRIEEACLYKRKGTCGLCIKACPSSALSKEGFDRKKCYDRCLENAAVHRDKSSSYGAAEIGIGSEVCGKCVAGMPCAFRRP